MKRLILSLLFTTSALAVRGYSLMTGQPMEQYSILGGLTFDGILLLGGLFFAVLSIDGRALRARLQMLVDIWRRGGRRR